MKTSESQTRLVAALMNAWEAFPAIAKEKNGQAGNRQFKYAPHEVILEAVKPILIANGLLLTHSPDGHELVTRLDHVSGEWRESRTPVNKEHANLQSLGIEFTYLRRYATQLMLGIITEEDTDGQGGKKSKAGGVDNTVQKNANGTERLEGGSHSPSKLIFDSLQSEVRDALRRKAPSVDAAMPDAAKALSLAEMIIDDWPDLDRNDVKVGLWHLLDSKTRSAIKRHQQITSMTKGMTQ